SLMKPATDAINPLASVADLLVVNGQAGVPSETADRVEGVPGVGEVQPLVIGRVALPDLDNRSVLLIGVDVARMLAGKGGEGVAAETWGIKVNLTSDPLELADLFNPKSKRTHAVVSADLAADLKAARADGFAHFRARVAGEERNLNGVGTVTLSGP